MPRFLPALGGTVIAVVATAVLAHNLGLLPGTGNDSTPTPSVTTASPSPLPTASPSPSPRPTAPPIAAEVSRLLNDFLAARVAGKGAQRYLNSSDGELPLLYATTSGAPYERAEFEQVLGIEWPYGYIAFLVRMFAGATVVEQLVFIGPDAPLLVSYQWDGFRTDIPPTTEDGRPVAEPYSIFDGQVTMQVAHPWFLRFNPFGELLPEGPGVDPSTDGGERVDWDRLVLIADPVPVGTQCHASAPADAAALAQSIRSLSYLEATDPVAVRVGANEAVMMEMKTGARTVCAEALYDQQCPSFQASCRMRIYLFDVPGGLSMRILAIGIIAPEATFDRAVHAAQPVVNSVEFHVP